MSTENLIAAKQFCIYHQIEEALISELQEAGLVEITVIDRDAYIPQHELQKLETLIRLRIELEINTPGIEAISHMLQRMEDMQQEMLQLRNRLRLYE